MAYLFYGASLYIFPMLLISIASLFFRVPLSSGGSLVIEQTEALVSIDVNGGHVMLRQRTSQEKAILDVNLAAAKRVC
jgi:Ribonuclease G/E